MNGKMSLCFVLAGFVLFAFFSAEAQPVLDPNDTVVVYDAAHPPSPPPKNTLVKWVKTTRVPWNTAGFKCYCYNYLPFRLKFPHSYTAAPDGRTYPLFIFFHGAGETGAVTDNELQLFRGGQLHSNAVDSGVFDGFLLYPQSPTGNWDVSQLDNIAALIRQYFVPQIKVDTTRIIVSGLSSGGQAVWQFAQGHPQLTAAALPMSAASAGVMHPPVLGIPIWLFQGALDTDPDPATGQLVADYYKSIGGLLTFTLYQTLGHDTWDSAWKEPGYFPFLVKARKTPGSH
jgi:predicted esterase